MLSAHSVSDRPAAAAAHGSEYRRDSMRPAELGGETHALGAAYESQLKPTGPRRPMSSARSSAGGAVADDLGGTVGAHGDDAFVVGVEYGRAAAGRAAMSLDFRGNGVARTVVAHVVVADDGDDADARLEQGEFQSIRPGALAQLADAETVVSASAGWFGDVRGPVVLAIPLPSGRGLRSSSLVVVFPRPVTPI